ncbi:MAG TPA: hypothetical protein VFA98_15780, partial [Thermoanaerobaculia bacterium]|nr:hypothetical protein [Thermoanaerobaculia bacterium]
MRRYGALACGVLCALLISAAGLAAEPGQRPSKKSASSTITVGHSVKNDVSPPLREIPPKFGRQPQHLQPEPLGMPPDI